MKPAHGESWQQLKSKGKMEKKKKEKLRCLWVRWGLDSLCFWVVVKNKRKCRGYQHTGIKLVWNDATVLFLNLANLHSPYVHVVNM